MNYKVLFSFVTIYAIALFVNLFQALKHPDSSLGVIHVLTSILFICITIYVIKKLNANKWLEYYLVMGILSGLIVYFSNMLEYKMEASLLTDVITSLQYPFYILFTTPLFV